MCEFPFRVRINQPATTCATGAFGLFPLLTLSFFAWILAACSGGHDAPTSEPGYQQQYQPIETDLAIHTLEDEAGRTLYYIDEGDPLGTPVVLVSGFGTSVTAALLTTHLRQLRDQLGIRLISVQRGGYGPRPYQAEWGYRDYVTEVESVLAALGVSDFHLFAISGGGPYAARIVAAMPGRLRSIHLAATITGNNEVDGQGTLPDNLALLCNIAAASSTPVASVGQVLGSFALDSADAWWGFSEDNPMLTVPGFERAAEQDWHYTFFTGDSGSAIDALAAESIRYCELALPDLAAGTTAVYIYHGEEDESAPGSNVHAWQQALVNASDSKVRRYPAEGHWVQYSHLEQIYTDIILPGYLVVCDAEGVSQWLEEHQGQALLAAGEVQLGMCR